MLNLQAGVEEQNLATVQSDLELGVNSQVVGLGQAGMENIQAEAVHNPANALHFVVPVQVAAVHAARDDLPVAVSLLVAMQVVPVVVVGTVPSVVHVVWEIHDPVVGEGFEGAVLAEAVVHTAVEVPEAAGHGKHQQGVVETQQVTDHGMLLAHALCAHHVPEDAAA